MDPISLRYNDPMKLLGDFISDVAQALGIRECERCKRRKTKLNAAHARLRGGKRARCVECAKARRMGGSS
jgi:hypothetical protein